MPTATRARNDRSGTVLVGVALVLSALFLLAPLVLIFVQAFSAGLDVYLRHVTEPATRHAIRLTVLTALVVVPINVVFFAYLADGDRRYLARSWLIAPDEQAAGSGTGGRKTKIANWTGDWYVSFGDGLGRSWKDGLRYSFVSAGGGDWFSRTLRGIPAGSRIFVNIPQTGYVAVGQTTGEATAFADALVEVDGRTVRLADQALNAPYQHEPRDGEDTTEYVVPVQWTVARPKEHAYWEKGMFANQNSACKLRQEFTLEKLRAHFGIDA